MDVSNLLVEVFMKVVNGLVMTLEEDKIFMCLAVLLPIGKWRFQDIDQVLLIEIIFFCFSIFSGSDCISQNYFHLE